MGEHSVSAKNGKKVSCSFLYSTTLPLKKGLEKLSIHLLSPAKLSPF